MDKSYGSYVCVCVCVWDKKKKKIAKQASVKRPCDTYSVWGTRRKSNLPRVRSPDRTISAHNGNGDCDSGGTKKKKK